VDEGDRGRLNYPIRRQNEKEIVVVEYLGEDSIRNREVFRKLWVLLRRLSQIQTNLFADSEKVDV
jgi:hypothetical protein